MKRPQSQREFESCEAPLAAMLARVGGGGESQRSGGLAARLLRTASLSQQPAASNVSGGSSDVALPAAAPPPLLSRPVSSRPSTFLDVATMPAQPGEPQRAADAAVRADLPAFMSRILDSSRFRPDGGAAGAELPAAAAAPLAPSRFEGAPPTDFSLKSGARFSSRAPFHWARCPPAEAESQGLAAFLGCEQASTHQALLVRALTSAVFPDAHWPPGVCAALARLDNGRELTLRRERWAAAFRSLYYQLRTCRCDYFYVLLPDVFSVLFCAPGVRGAPLDAGMAILTPSTRGLRQRLRSYGVAFNTPLAPDADAGATEALEELAEYERHNPGSTRGAFQGAAGAVGVDGTPRSSTVVCGCESLQALYNFLYDFRLADSSRDVPALLAGAPFAHCALRQLQLATGTRTREQAAAQQALSQSQATTSARRERVHAAILSGGVVAPWHVSRLLELFRDTQEGDFTLRLDTLPPTAAFNLAAAEEAARALHSCAAADDDDVAARVRVECAPRGAFGSAEERAAARGPHGWADCVAEGLQCVEGAFSTLAPQPKTGGNR